MRISPFLAVAIGIFFAILVRNIGSAHTLLAKFGNLTEPPQESKASAQDLEHLDRMKPQKQAETLLELAVGRSDAAVEQISSRADRWQGKIRWTSQIATLTTAAMNSSDMRVRESGIEVELAAYGLAKNPASFEYVLQTVASPDHAKKIWGLWALGLMGNRGVETARAIDILTTHLKDYDEDSRRWAAEGLALTGKSEAIPILLQTMHDDPSPLVRERAACGLAESGMFNSEVRQDAVPQLLNFTDDPALDAQTHSWAFQALADITHQRLPKDSETWRNWYRENRGQ